ncbi:MAG: hypothetical protein R2693_06935 [Nocardioidaceae bacterium]
MITDPFILANGDDLLSHCQHEAHAIVVNINMRDPLQSLARQIRHGRKKPVVLRLG